MRMYNYLDATPWSTRGWTMQEKFLSRRSLIFTQEQVHFVCAEASYSEETYSEVFFPKLQPFHVQNIEMSLHHTGRHFAEDKDPCTAFWRRYSALVRRFTSRAFTYDGDVFDAFDAIVQALESVTSDKFLWGVPITSFELGLMWTTFDGQDKRGALTTLPMTNLNQKVPFPSWSWMAWTGETSIVVDGDNLDNEAPVIECYVHQSTNEGTGIVRMQEIVQNREIDLAGLRVALPPVLWQHSRQRTVDLKDLQTKLEGFNAAELASIPDHHVLFFWTSLAKLHVAKPTDITQAQRLRAPMRQVFCSECSTIEQHLGGFKQPLHTLNTNPQETSSYCPNILDAESNVVGSSNRMKASFWQSGNYDTGLHEFIVIGRRVVAGLEDVFPATLLVMQVERREGIWYRLSMGEISEDEWNKADSDWRLIVLG